MTNPPVYHVQFMARLTAQMAKFFSSVTQLCIQELNQHIYGNKQKQLKNGTGQSYKVKNQEIDNNGKIMQQTNKKKQQDNDKNHNGIFKNHCDQQVIISQQSNSSKKKKKKTQKRGEKWIDNQPKAPASPFLLYYQQNKNQISVKHNLTASSQLIKIATQEWKKLSQNERTKYQKNSQEEQVKYHAAMKIYNQKKVEQMKEERRRKQRDYKARWLQKKKAEKKAAEIQQKEQTVSSNSSKSEEISSSESSKSLEDSLNQKVNVKPIITLDDSSSQSNKGEVSV